MRQLTSNLMQNGSNFSKKIIFWIFHSKSSTPVLQYCVMIKLDMVKVN